MILYVGLGNPGVQYEATRHNIGRSIVQQFQHIYDLPEFLAHPQWDAVLSKGRLEGKHIVLLLPNTLVNRSGMAVVAAARYFKISAKHLFVIHDDADILTGYAKLSFGKNSAGHKGVDSIIKALKTKEFWRFRIGIGKKRDVPAEDIVLKKFTPEEAQLVKKVTKKTIDALQTVVAEEPELVMNTYNQHLHK